MADKKKENAVVVSQEQLADGIFSLWLQTEASKEARPGQFISMYTNDGTKLLPRPISICEINKEAGQLRVVYRVTGENTGTEQFSRAKAGDIIPVVGPLGNGFPLEKAEGKKAFLMGGGIGVPPILELAKQLDCEKQIVVGYRDSHTFLKEQFEQNGSLYISTEDGSYLFNRNSNLLQENKIDKEAITSSASILSVKPFHIQSTSPFSSFVLSTIFLLLTYVKFVLLFKSNNLLSSFNSLTTLLSAST